MVVANRRQLSRSCCSVFVFILKPSRAALSTSTHFPTTMDPLERWTLPRPLVLGSASFTRKLILEEMNIPYVICARPIDEKNLGDRDREAPHDLVLKLANAKMDHLVLEIKAGHCAAELADDSFNSGMVILTGDQVVTWKSKILEKPESIDEARQMVTGYAISPPSTVGSCVLHHLPSDVRVSGVDEATIHFLSTLPPQLVDDLVAANEPVLSCAGGLMVEHPLVQIHLDRIDGTQDSVMGLSKDLVERLLADLAAKIVTNGQA